MNIERRLQFLERMEPDWESLSDAELDRLAGPPDPVFSRWLRTLTDAELDILCSKSPYELNRRYREYQNKTR